MSEQETYNGWANRETWAMALHINNDQGWQESVHMELRSAAGWTDEYVDGKPHIDAREAGEIIRENIDELVQNVIEEPAMHTRDLRMALHDIGSLWRVNWTELGAAFLEDISED